MPLVILADDLTGAADCAARCRHAGLPASICLDPPTPPLPDGAVAITSESRDVPPTEAAARVYETIAPLRGRADLHWYKKIDSTLRGNLGAELDATLDALRPGDGQACAIISPAFPAYRRGLEDGYLVGDSIAPRAVHLPTLLRQQAARSVAAVSLPEVRAGVDTLTTSLSRAIASGCSLLAVDALTDDDLRTLVRAAERAAPDALLCGSAGLVSMLAQRHASGASISPDATALPPGPVLAVVGSGSGMAHRQLDTLRRHGRVRVVEVRPDCSGAAPLARAAWSQGDVALHREPRGVRPPHPVAPDAITPQPPGHLAAVAVQLITDKRPARLILAGGATAMAVLSTMGVRRLEVQHELLPGMPLARGVDADGRDLCVVLKAGNHGDDDTLAALFCGSPLRP